MRETMTIFEAIAKGDAPTLRSLLAADPAAVRARNEAGLSALMIALYYRKQDLLEMLLQAGPSIDGFEASALGLTDLLRQRLAAEPDLATAWTSDGFTGLHLACFFGHEEAVRVLLDHGAVVNAAAKNPMKVQPLHSAAASGRSATIALLLDRGADVNAQQEGGMTALHAAAHSGHVEMARILLGRNADSAIKSADGRTASDIAREKGHSAVLHLLADR